MSAKLRESCFFCFFWFFLRFYCLFLVLLGSLNKLIYIILQNTQKPWFSSCVTLWLFGCLRVNCCTSADLLDNYVFLILENGQKTPNPISKYTHIYIYIYIYIYIVTYVYVYIYNFKSTVFIQHSLLFQQVCFGTEVCDWKRVV